MSIVRVALDKPLPILFDYALPAGMEVRAGQLLLVPFGRGHAVGVAVECAAASELDAARIKPVVRVLDDVPPLSADVLALLHFCSDYYHYPLGAAVLSALPARLRSSQPVTLKEQVQYQLSEKGRAQDPEQLPKRNTAQRRVLAAMQAGAEGTDHLRALVAGVPAALKPLLAAGLVEIKQTEPAPDSLAFDKAHELTASQQDVVAAVSQARGYACFLLHGITGSGKTEVYVHLMHRMLQQGGQALLLVPEINLTPQLEEYFRSRFPGAELVSLHSGLADGERTRNWLRAQSGRARIVLGTRLAVFTPLPRLALLVVDEEHDASFKQQDGLRYSARDVAIFRASQAKVPIVLGSATPSLESYYNAQTGRYTLLTLAERASGRAQLPTVRCVDTRNMLLHHGISEPILAGIEERLRRGEQSLVFINRRGYAPVLMCTACGWLSGCAHCSGKLVLHLADRSLRCHHCGHHERVPHACPNCGNADLNAVGSGTQRVESALKDRFPMARVLRVDKDTTRNKGAWNDMRQSIRHEAVDILVGTQMLAKGHDFHNLTLVGVLNSDHALYSSDFRASERLFAQLAQVAGRAGRAGKPGEVLIQTAFPDHPLFRALISHDYPAWARALLTERKDAGFPPFVHQAMLRAEGRQEDTVYGFLEQARAAAVRFAVEVEVYGVVPAVLARRAAHSRAQLLVQSQSRRSLQQFLRAWKPALDALPAPRLRWSLDIDPLDF